MKKYLFAMIALCFFGASHKALAVEIVQKDNLELDLNGRAQLLGVGEHVNDSFKDSNRLYLFMKQARLITSGKYDQVQFHVEMGFAGEDEQVLAPNPGVALNLLDFYADIPIWETIHLRVGQFLVPYSRERMTDEGTLQFANQSIHNLAFQMGRDVGAAVHAYPGPLSLAFGVFAGGGRDIPQRFIPENLGTPLFVFRAGINRGLDEGIFGANQHGASGLKQHEFAVDETKFAAFIDGLYMHDSLIGHSTVLNVKTSDKSLLLNSNWNPFISQAPLLKGHLVQAGADVAVRTPLGSSALSAEAEANYGRYSNSYGNVNLAGGRAQVGICHKSLEYAVRYAALSPDASFANNGTPITGRLLIHEVTPALTYHLKQDRAKIILDAPLLVNAPVATEPNVGAYVLTEQPDQAAVLAPKTGGAIARKFVAEGRVLLQVAF